MKFSQTSSDIKIKQIISIAENANITKDFELFQNTIFPIWEDINQTPDFSQFEHEAELLHLAGEFLSNYGKANNLKDFQSRSKDLLSQARDLFLFRDEPEKALNSQSVLAWSYFHEGSKGEFEAYLLDGECNYTGNKTHSSYLRIQCNLITCITEKGELSSAKKRIENNFDLVKKCKDLKIKYQFCLEAGITYQLLELYKDSITFFKLGLKFADQHKNNNYKALLTNCLANTYRCNKQFRLAYETINLAIEIAQDQPGYLANFYDTKALIFYDLERYKEAELWNDISIDIFQRGEDAAGLCEAYFTRTQILIAATFPEEAFEQFLDLYNLALNRIGQSEANKYRKQFFKLITFATGKTLPEQVKNFTRRQVEQALLLSNGKITKAADLLGINYTTLSKMIKNKFSSVNALINKQRKPRSKNKIVK